MSWTVDYKGQKMQIRIERNWWRKPVSIYLGDENLGNWPKMSELSSGKIYRTQDGSELKIQMKSFPQELHMTFNNQVVEGSAADPKTRVKTAYSIMVFIACINLLIGAIAILFKIQALLQLGFGIYNVIIGILYASLLAVGYKKQTLIPLAAGLLLFLGDAMMMVKTMILLQMINPGAFIVRIMFIIPWARGVYELFKSDESWN